MVQSYFCWAILALRYDEISTLRLFTLFFIQSISQVSLTQCNVLGLIRRDHEYND